MDSAALMKGNLRDERLGNAAFFNEKQGESNYRPLINTIIFIKKYDLKNY